MQARQCFVQALTVWLIGCVGYTPVQPPPVPPLAPPSIQISHEPAHGNVGEHDRLDFSTGNFINAYPYWPPRGSPNFLVIHYNNGDTIWGEPSYGTPDCPDFAHCRRATFRINPTWQKGVPQGRLYEVLTLDSRPVLDSGLLQVIDPQSRATVYLAFAYGAWFAAPSVTELAAKVQQAQTVAQNSQGGPVAQGTGSGSALATGAQAFGTALGVALAAALALGVVYLAAREQTLANRTPYRPMTCTSRQFPPGTWTTQCY